MSIRAERIIANSPEDPLHRQNQPAGTHMAGWLLLVLIVALLINWLIA